MEGALWTQAALWMQLVEAGRWRQLVGVVGAALWVQLVEAGRWRQLVGVVGTALWVQLVVALWWQLVECALCMQVVVAENWLAMTWLEDHLELSLLRG